MDNKYHIVLIPASKANAFIKCADFLANIADQYLLGKYSFPHVTLFQLEANEWHIEQVWQKIYRELNPSSIELIFEKFSCITFNKLTYWASLLPDKCDQLITMHVQIADILSRPIKVNYDPHLSLISTQNSSYINLVNDLSKKYQPIRDVFVLALGKADEVGQITEMIYSSQPC